MLRAPTATLLAALAAGCATGSGGEDLAELRRAADALVPASSEVVSTSEGVCVQVDGNPTCVRVFLTSALPEERRAADLERAARSAGWEVTSRERGDVGTALELEREGYRAFAVVWATGCGDGPVDEACADEIQVLEE